MALTGHPLRLDQRCQTGLPGVPGAARRRAPLPAVASTATPTVAPQLAEAHAEAETHRRPEAHAEVAPAAQEAFVWTKQWYPLAVEKDLDPKKPFGTKLLGKDLVIWSNGPGSWRCFEDVCPHRLAPLSQGRIEDSDNTLQCAYHGWRFGEDGKAAAIPQAGFDSPQAERTACASRRSAVQSYPIQVRIGLLWVWPEAGPASFVEAFAAQPAYNSRLDDITPEEVAFTTNLNFVRDFPMAYDVLYENISDQARSLFFFERADHAQSHVPWAHHGVASKRTSPWAAHFVVSNVNKDLQGPGYTYDLEWSPDAINPPISQRVRGVPPCYIEYLTPKADGAFTVLWFYVVPLDHHSTRVFNNAVIVQKLNPALKALAAARPRWVDHLLLNEIFDGDMAYLCTASEVAKRRDPSGGRWAQDYFLPATSDRSAIAWLRWLHGPGGGGWAKAAGVPIPPPPPLTREQTLDRLHQHTAGCPDCRRGLAQARAGRELCVGAAALLALTLGLELAGGQSPLGAWPLLQAGALAAALGLRRLLGLAEAKFTFTDYDHAKR